jgi:hypothetical protein
MLFPAADVGCVALLPQTEERIKAWPEFRQGSLAVSEATLNLCRGLAQHAVSATPEVPACIRR